MMRPRTIWVKVSTELLAELTEWSDPVQVRVEKDSDDTYGMVFRRYDPECPKCRENKWPSDMDPRVSPFSGPQG